MTRLAFVLFGEFRAAVGARPIVLPLKKAQALVAYLALTPGTPHTREHLATLLWGDAPDEQARNSLRQTLFALRAALGSRRLVAQGERVWLAVDDVDVDVHRLERLAAEGSSRALEEAASLYRGDVLEGLEVDVEGFATWLDATRQRTRRTAMTALGRLLEHRTKIHALEEAVATAERLLRLDPLQERAHRALIRLYDRQGRRADAVQQYRACVDLLRRELGTTPEPATEAAYRALVPDRIVRPAPAGRSRNGGEARLPFVGRAAELSELRQRLARAASGHGGVVAVLGEAGIGKTRLTEELIAAIPDGDALILRGRAYESGRVLPFALWVETLEGEARQRMPELEGLGHAWARDLDPLFPGLRRPTARAPRPGDRLRLFEAMSEFIGWLAAGRTLLVALEDLHWADDMSVRLLAYLGRRFAGWPVLALVTARTEELDGSAVTGALAELARDGHLVRLTLGPLSVADGARLARSLAPADVSAPDLSAVIARSASLSEGNPFVLTEMMREAVRVQSPATAPGVVLPKTVRELIMSRVRRLSAEDQRLVALAALIGRRFDPQLLAVAAGTTDLETVDAAERLVRAGLFRVLDDQVDVAHDRIREAVAAELQPPRRRVLHAAVARALEPLHGKGDGSVASELARHYEAAAMWEPAVHYLRTASAQAAVRGAYREAVAFLERALAVLARVPETREWLERGVDVRIELRNGLFALDESASIGLYLEEAEAMARRLSDERRWARVATRLAHHSMALGEPAKALATLRQTTEIAERLHDPELRLLSNFFLGRTYHTLGDYPASVRVLRDAAALVGDVDASGQGDGPELIPLRAFLFLTSPLSRLGEFEEARAIAQRARRTLERMPQRPMLALAEYAMGQLLIECREMAPALAALERAQSLLESRENPQNRTFVDAWLGYARALSGKTEDGITLLRRAVDEPATLTPWLGRRIIALLVEALLLDGRAAEALGWAERGLALTRKAGERGNEAIALHALGNVRAALDDAARAESCYREGLARAEVLGMRPLMARCHLALGRLQRQLGRTDDGDDALDTAMRLFTEMGLHAWADEARAERETAPVRS